VAPSLAANYERQSCCGYSVAVVVSMSCSVLCATLTIGLLIVLITTVLRKRCTLELGFVRYSVQREAKSSEAVKLLEFK
jgi:hypothetical protein